MNIKYSKIIINMGNIYETIPEEIAKIYKPHLLKIEMGLNKITNNRLDKKETADSTKTIKEQLKKYIDMF